jgi:hypothetical protein
MGLPIIGDILDLVGKGVDKIFPDKDKAMKIKSEMKLHLLEQAMTEKKLLFQDTNSARELYKAELAAKDVPKLARLIQVLARPFAMYSMITMYVYVKIAPLIGAMIGKDLPVLVLNEKDYYLIGTVFVFLFGARTLEKLKDKAKN